MRWRANPLILFGGWAMSDAWKNANSHSCFRFLNGLIPKQSTACYSLLCTLHPVCCFTCVYSVKSFVCVWDFWRTYIRIKCTLIRLKWYITITIQRCVWEARHTQRLSIKQSAWTFAWGALSYRSIAWNWEEALDDLPWKNERGPSSVRRISGQFLKATLGTRLRDGMERIITGFSERIYHLELNWTYLRLSSYCACGLFFRLENGAVEQIAVFRTVSASLCKPAHS